MRSYVLIATIFFWLATVVQLLRLLLRWTVVVSGVNIPLWLSGIAVIIVGSLAIAGMRVLSRSQTPQVAV